MAGKYNICLDIGGTKVLGAIFDSNDEIVCRYKKKSTESGSSSQNVQEVIISVVEELLATSARLKRSSECPSTLAMMLMLGFSENIATVRARDTTTSSDSSLEPEWAAA